MDKISENKTLLIKQIMLEYLKSIKALDKKKNRVDDLRREVEKHGKIFGYEALIYETTLKLRHVNEI